MLSSYTLISVCCVSFGIGKLEKFCNKYSSHQIIDLPLTLHRIKTRKEGISGWEKNPKLTHKQQIFYILLTKHFRKLQASLVSSHIHAAKKLCDWSNIFRLKLLYQKRNVPSSDTSWNDVTDLPSSFSSHNCDQTD